MIHFRLFHLSLGWFFVSCVRTRGGVPPLHAAVPRGAAPRGAPTSRAPSSRGRGVQRARGAPPAAGYRPAPPIVQDTYGEYVSILKVYMSVKIIRMGSWPIQHWEHTQCDSVETVAPCLHRKGEQCEQHANRAAAAASVLHMYVYRRHSGPVQSSGHVCFGCNNRLWTIITCMQQVIP